MCFSFRNLFHPNHLRPEGFFNTAFWWNFDVVFSATIIVTFSPVIKDKYKFTQEKIPFPKSSQLWNNFFTFCFIRLWNFWDEKIKFVIHIFICRFPESGLNCSVVVDGDHLWPLLHRPPDLAEAALLVQAQTCRTSRLRTERRAKRIRKEYSAVMASMSQAEAARLLKSEEVSKVIFFFFCENFFENNNLM